MVSTAASRMIRAVHAGRIDPVTMKWNYAAGAKTTDVAGLLRRAGADEDLGAVLDSLEPKFAHYQRARRKLALYKAAAQKGEPPLVPALAKGQTKIVPGKPWEGVPQLVARLTATGDLSAEAAANFTLAARPERPGQRVRQRRVVPHVGHRSQERRRAPAHERRRWQGAEHGCIRVEDPGAFAEWVLRLDPTWTRERIDAAMRGNKTMQVNLKEKLTVVVFYDTVHVNSEQVVHFVDDIYGHDKALDAALQRAYPFAVARRSATS